MLSGWSGWLGGDGAALGWGELEKVCHVVYGGEFCAACIIDYVAKWMAAELVLMHTVIPQIDT